MLKNLQSILTVFTRTIRIDHEFLEGSFALVAIDSNRTSLLEYIALFSSIGDFQFKVIDFSCNLACRIVD